jgi:hypothetical protein
MGFVSTQAFASAYDLGVFDALTLESATVDDIARRIDIRPVAGQSITIGAMHTHFRGISWLPESVDRR